MIGELEHPVDVVLDQQHRQIRRDALDDGADALALRRGKTGQRLVEQQHARRGGERHAHVEQALAAIGQHAGFGLLDAGEAEIADGGVGLGIDRLDRAAHGVMGSKRWGCRACTARRMFSPTLSAGNRLVIWNERPMPARAISSGVWPAIGWPSSDTDALVRRIHAGQQIERRGLAGAVGADQRMQRAVGNGDVDPLHRLDAAKALDDVAGGQHRSLDVGFRPQEFRQRQQFDAARRHRGVLDDLLAERRDQPLADADQARRRKHDEADEHQAEPEQPVLGVDAQEFAEQDEEQRAERRAQKAAHAADHDHRQQFAGKCDRDRIGRGHAVLVEQQDAGKPGDPGRQHEGGELVAVGRIAEEARALLVLADRHQHAADGRIVEAP